MRWGLFSVIGGHGHGSWSRGIYFGTLPGSTETYNFESAYPWQEKTTRYEYFLFIAYPIIFAITPYISPLPNFCMVLCEESQNCR
jgi:hypothetical protein